MTITLTKKKLAALVSVIVVSLVAVTTAGALDSFPDVADGRFFHDPVTWASTNGITTGTSPITFEPDRGVTRGESVTFLKRYDDNIVQPALATNTADIANNTSDIATNTADIATNTADIATTAADVVVLETNQVVGSARVLADGTILDVYMVNGNTPTVVHVAASGVYTITWTGVNVNINTRRGFAQIVGSTAGFANLSSVGGDLIVRTFNAAGVLTDMQFGVLIFDD